MPIFFVMCLLAPHSPRQNLSAPLYLPPCAWCSLGINAEMVKPFLEGWTLQLALEGRRLFIVNYAMFDGLSSKQAHALCAPIALFFLTADRRLLPIAIQLYQQIERAPVVLPTDPPNAWSLPFFTSHPLPLHFALHSHSLAATSTATLAMRF